MGNPVQRFPIQKFFLDIEKCWVREKRRACRFEMARELLL